MKYILVIVHKFTLSSGKSVNGVQLCVVRLTLKQS